MKKNSIIALSLIGIWACGTAATTESSEESTTTEISVVQDEKPVVQNLPQASLAAMMAKDSVIVIDVRTPGEVASGYIQGADSFIDISSGDFATRISALDKNYTYVMYCRSGARSGRASDFMIQNGFTKVYNLQGGILAYTGEIAKP